MAPYKFNTQMLIIVAACTLHNFIRQETLRDWLFQEYDINDLIVLDQADDGDYDDPNDDVPSQLQQEMGTFRDEIAVAMEHELGEIHP